MRNFELETYFSKWEFVAKYNLAASDAESLSLEELLAMATPDEKESFMSLWLGYTETWGSPELRQVIAQTYDTMADKNILCFHGAEEGIYTAMRVLLNKSDHAIVVVPNYQAAETIPLDICEVTGVPLAAGKHWQIDVDDIKRAIKPNTKLISINFPNNPTGATISKTDLDAIISLCRHHGIYLFSDEVYRLLEVDENKRLPQVADIYERGFSLNVMSKAYGLPGLRIGWIASQQTDLLLQFERYKHYLSICNSAPSEKLAFIALNHREKILQRNRDLIQSNLVELNQFFQEYKTLFEWQQPDGGCIAYPQYLGKNGVANFCDLLVENYGVLLLPGSVYRSDLFELSSQHFRIGFGRKNMIEGLNQLRRFLNE
ncbi:aminotransferase class I/II-fold pyridoxal phosphate-dependent enzyme [Aliikangiella sp. IMCC44359]|uniref:aminotransferase class I/II-fold pyridoxal phosphate-dependent enzyme n=1 Tax=Aliikangiella sp. IMCC44359 TaxID=3459125 RepID=UPI00403A9214